MEEDKNSNTAVSTLGRFRRLDSGKIVKPWFGSKFKYLYLEIKQGDKIVTKLAHRLVATAFVKNPDPKRKIETNHLNGIKADITPGNLEWVTPSENIIHAFATGLTTRAKGVESSNSKLTMDQVIEIRSKRYINFNEYARKFNVCKNTISRCYYKLSYIDGEA